MSPQRTNSMTHVPEDKYRNATPPTIREVLERLNGEMFEDLDDYLDQAVPRILATREFTERDERVAALQEALERYGQERLVLRVAALERMLWRFIDQDHMDMAMVALKLAARALLAAAPDGAEPTEAAT